MCQVLLIIWILTESSFGAVDQIHQAVFYGFQKWPCKWITYIYIHLCYTFNEYIIYTHTCV